MLRGIAQVITFAAVDSASPPARKTGLTFASGDAKISKDGGAFASTSNVPTEISNGRYALSLTASELDAIWVHIQVEKTGMQPVDVSGGTSGHTAGSVASGTPTTTSFITNLASTVDNFYKDAYVLFVTGALAGQLKKISGYVGSTKTLTVASFTAAPSVGDRFLLITF